MQVVVSMYFETVSFVRRPVLVPHIAAEERVISSACSLIVSSSRFLELDKECFVFRRPGVGVARRWRQEIRQRSFMTFRGGVTPVNREADVPELLAVDFHARQAIGDHGGAFDRTARRRNFDLRSVRDS